MHGNGAHLDDYETHDERRLLPGSGFTIEPGVYFAMNVGPAVLGPTVQTAAEKIATWGYIITPEQMQAVAAQLYVELLRGGYTQVCEFHYLQHDLDGTPYAERGAMAWQLAERGA